LVESGARAVPQLWHGGLDYLRHEAGHIYQFDLVLVTEVHDVVDQFFSVLLRNHPVFEFLTEKYPWHLSNPLVYLLVVAVTQIDCVVLVRKLLKDDLILVLVALPLLPGLLSAEQATTTAKTETH
jgi:hypothetical protein